MRSRIVAVLLLFMACSSPQTEDAVRSDSLDAPSVDTTSALPDTTRTVDPVDSAVTTSHDPAPPVQTEEEVPDTPPAPRSFVQFAPQDRHMNGEPLWQPVEMDPDVLAAHPDTLTGLATAYYRMAIPSFPVSIADDFERGVSTEHIDHPDHLTFRFELFATAWAEESYAEHLVTVRYERTSDRLVVD